MNAAWGQVAGVVTLTLMALFIAIGIWAWRPRHRREFEALARLPMSDAPADGANDEDASP
jgi:cbb3-type cytochrome oxidase subunit 3